MAYETQVVTPVFDPKNPEASLDKVGASLLLNSKFLRGSLMGEAVSRLIGDGMEIDGVHEMEPGDDLKHLSFIDTADDPDEIYIQDYQAEISPNVWIVSDMLQSRNNVKNPGYFREQNLAMSGVATFLRISRSLGLPHGFIASTDTGLLIPNPKAKTERSHSQVIVERIAAEMLEDHPQKRADFRLADLMRFAAQKCTNSVVVLATDFRDSAPKEWKDQLIRLGQTNELFAIQTTNRRDFQLSALHDKSGNKWIGSSARATAKRAKYAADTAKQQIAINDNLTEAGVTNIELSADYAAWQESIVEQLKRKH